MGEEGDRAGGWHLDKRVPIAIILAIFVQTAGVVWWAARLEARVERMEQYQTDDAPAKAAAGAADSRHDQAIVRLETQFAQVAEAIHEMNAKLDRLIEHGQPPAR